MNVVRSDKNTKKGSIYNNIYSIKIKINQKLNYINEITCNIFV